MKKIILTIISLFLISFSLVSCTKGNDEVEVASLEYKDNGDGTSTVIGIGNYFSEDLVIPEKDNNGNIVTSIADKAFLILEDEYDSLPHRIKSVKIADTVTYIGEYAFFGNFSVKKLELPQNGSLSIGGHAFGHLSITQAIMPKYFTILDNYSYNPSIFFECIKLVEIFYDSSLCTIDLNLLRNSFFGVESDIIIHQNLDEESIIDSSNPFYSSYKKGENYYLLDYDVDAYLNKYGSNDITLPFNIVYKGISIDSYNIHDGCFMFNSTIYSVVIPNSVKEIGMLSFYDCRNLKYISFSNSIEKIDFEAFAKCVSLYTVTIPSSVTFLGDNVFALCTNLSFAYVDASIDELPRYTFSECKIDNLYLNKNIKELGVNCLAKCEINSIVFPDGIKVINNWALYKCNNLEYVYIPKSVVTISRAFDECLKLKELEYEGTMEDWNQIDSKFGFCYIQRIICSDGIIKL